MLKESTQRSIDNPTSNQYYLLGVNKEVVEWDIYSRHTNPDQLWTDYPGKILQTVEQSLSDKGLTFYLTREELDDLPSYGKNVVVIIAADEWCRIPKYAHRVLAVFKSYGIKPFLGCNPILEPSYINFASLIQFLRIWTACLPRLINYGVKVLKSLGLGRLEIPKVYTIPLGYYNQIDVPQRKLHEREYDIFFAGSITDSTYPPTLIKQFIVSLLTPPKIQSRQRMISFIRQFQDKFPNFKIKLSVTSGFYAMTEGDIKTYAEQLMDSKICLIPRGTSYETYRFFEAIRFGCIPIFEALPPHWFYDDSLGIKVKNWNSLPTVLKELLSNPDLMESKHQRALWWWDQKCSEAAVGQYIVSQLKGIASM